MSRIWLKTIKRIIRRHTSWYWNASKVFHYFESKKLQHLTVLEGEKLIDYLVKHNKSFIRWGDGESAILYGSDLTFQDYDPELKNEMIYLLNNHNDNENFLLGIPGQFICFGLNDYKNQPGKRQYIWRVTRYVMHKYCSTDTTYGDAFLFRPLSDVTNADLQKLWKYKHVILLSSDIEHAAKIESNTSPASIHQIQIPKNNCYQLINELELKVEELIHDLNFKTNNLTILISGGPGGKVLAHRLILKNYRVYDLGNYFSWKIDGKTNEKGI